MRARFGVVCALAAVLGLDGSVIAEPLNLEDIPAKAKWVAHVDVDAMRNSTILNKGCSECVTMAKQLEEFRTACEVFEPVADLKGVTFYATEFKPNAVVAIFYANYTRPVLDFFFKKVEQQSDYTKDFHGIHQLGTWTRGKGTANEQRVTAHYLRPNRVILTASVETMAEALDVIDGEKPGLSGNSSRLAASVPPGTVLLVRTVGQSAASDANKSPILKQSEAISFSVCNADNKVRLSGELPVKNAEESQQVKTALEGFLAAALSTTGDANLAEVIKAVKVDSTDKIVTANVEVPAENAWPCLKLGTTRAIDEGGKYMGWTSSSERAQK